MGFHQQNPQKFSVPQFYNSTRLWNTLPCLFLVPSFPFPRGSSTSRTSSFPLLVIALLPFDFEAWHWAAKQTSPKITAQLLLRCMPGTSSSLGEWEWNTVGLIKICFENTLPKPLSRQTLKLRFQISNLKEPWLAGYGFSCQNIEIILVAIWHTLLRRWIR